MASSYSKSALYHFVQNHNLADWQKSWRNYIQSQILPLAECGSHLRQAVGSGHSLQKYVDEIATIAQNIARREDLSPQPKGCKLNDFLKYAADVTAYYSPHTFFALSIRKITKLHFHLHYGDPSQYSDVLNKLGFQWTSQDWYDLSGFADWTVKASRADSEYRLQLPNAINAKSLGALIVLLNETIWDMVTSIPSLSQMFLYGGKPLDSIYKEYLRRVRENIFTIYNKRIDELSNNLLKEIMNDIIGIYSFSVDKVLTLRHYERSHVSLIYWYVIPHNTQKVILEIDYAEPLPGISSNVLRTYVYVGDMLKVDGYRIDGMEIFWNTYLDLLMPLVMSGFVELIEADTNTRIFLEEQLKKQLGQRLSAAYSVVKRWER